MNGTILIECMLFNKEIKMIRTYIVLMLLLIHYIYQKKSRVDFF
jgi:hypothetical protein